MVICSPQMGLSPNSSLGGEVYDYQLLCHLAKLGVQVRVILPTGRNNTTYPPGITVDTVRFSRGRYSNWAFACGALDIFRKSDFDLLRVHSPRYVGLAGGMFHLRYPRVPVVVHHHHLDPNWQDRLMLKYVMTYADVVITVSDYSRRQLLETVGGNPNKVKVVYNGVSEASNVQFPDRDFLKAKGLSGQRLLVFVGRFIPRKNLSFLLKIFAEINQKYADVCLVLVGDGELRPELQRQVRADGLEGKVVFAGFVSEAEKQQWLKTADVFVSTSLLEGFGLNVAEAMACGCPVVVGNSGALSEIVVNEQTGYVVPPGDKTIFKNRILSILDDRALRIRLGVSARDHIRSHFTWERCAREVLSIYKALCAVKEKPQ